MLTAFGAFAVTVMLVSYWQEARSKWFILLLALGCVLTALYSAAAGAYPVTVVETIWSAVAVWRWRTRQMLERASG